MQVTDDNAHRILVTASYSEKAQGMIDAMLMTWTEYEAMGYVQFYKAVDSLTDEQRVDVAQNIIDRRNDRSK